MKTLIYKRTNRVSMRLLNLVLFLIMINTFNAKATGSLPPAKYSIDVDFTVIGKSMGFLFGATTTDNLYMWQLNCETVNHFKLRPHIRKNGSWKSFDVDASAVISEATKHDKHHMKIDVNLDTIKSYLDGTLVDTRIDATDLKGKCPGRIWLWKFWV